MSAKDFRSQPEPAPINSGPAQAHLQAKSTAQSANGENCAKLAFEPNESEFSGGPGVRIPAKCGFFQAERKRIPKTEDSLAERGGFEPSVPRGLLWTEFGPSLAHYSVR
jgi:hypothetical protein